MATTLKEIAQTAGVSSMTVSRVLSGNTGNKVSAGLAERIRRIASDMGYRPNCFGKAMRTGFVPLIALCLHRPADEEKHFNRYWYDMIVNFSRILERKNMELIFVPYATVEELAARTRSLKASGLMCGVISNLIPGTAEATCNILKGLDMPFVLLGNPGRTDIPCSYIDAVNIGGVLLGESRKKGAEELRLFRMGDTLSGEECSDEKLFFQVPGERERSYLTDRKGVAHQRIILVADMPENVTSSGGYVINNRTGDRCQACLDLLTAQLERREITEMSRVIRLEAKDITWIEPF